MKEINKLTTFRVTLITFWKPFLWSVVIGILSCIPGEEINNSKWTILPYQDKILHFIFYCILSLLLISSLLIHYKKNKPELKIIVISLSYVFFYGSILEIIQYQFISKREGDLIDVLFNMGGYLSAILLIYSILPFIKRKY